MQCTTLSMHGGCWHHHLRRKGALPPKGALPLAIDTGCGAHHSPLLAQAGMQTCSAERSLTFKNLSSTVHCIEATTVPANVSATPNAVLVLALAAPLWCLCVLLPTPAGPLRCARSVPVPAITVKTDDDAGAASADAAVAAVGL